MILSSLLSKKEECMPIQFFPKPGMVLICDFETGFQPPEMVKKRRVIVLSPHRLTAQMATVVPVSTTVPAPEMAHHARFEAAAYPFFHQDKPCWAKCDIIHTISLERLDRIRVGGKYASPSISVSDLDRVRKAAASALGLTINA